MINCGLDTEKDFFVDNYEIEGDHIEVFYANGTSEIIKKTSVNQEKLLAKMTSQVPKLEKGVLKSRKKLMKHLMFLGVDLIGFISSSVLFYNATGWVSIALAMLLELLIVVGAFTSGFAAWTVKQEYSILLNESEKFNMWLENQKLLEKHISTENIADQVDIVKKRSLDKNLNINVVDIMNLTALKELVLTCQKKEFSNDLERFTEEIGKQRTMGTMPGSDIEN